MASRFGWIDEGPDSSLLNVIAAREPNLARQRLALLIRALLNGVAFGTVWSHPEWTKHEWLAQRVPTARFHSLGLWAAAYLPRTASRLASLALHDDVSLLETCAMLSVAMRELDALPVASCEGRHIANGGASFIEWLAAPTFPGKFIVEQVAVDVRRQPPPLLAGLLLHGSAADSHVCPGYSDLDLHAVLATPVSEDGQELLDFLVWMMEANGALQQFNRFCHHGVMCVLELESGACSEAALPSAILHRGVWIMRPQREFTFVDDSVSILNTLAIFEPFFENPADHAGDLRGPFDAIWWTSSVLLLPLLLWPLRMGESIYKSEGLPRSGEVLSAASVSTLRRLEQLRMDVGAWIVKNAPQSLGKSGWPGSVLHDARRQRFNEDDREALGFHAELLLAGRKVWEEAAYIALDHVRKNFPEAFGEVRRRVFFSWPQRNSEHPAILAPAAYDEARAVFLERARQNPEVVGVFEFGKVGCPGLSDLDFLVVLSDAAQGIPAELKMGAFPPAIAEIIGHDALFVGEAALALLSEVFPIFDAELLYAAPGTRLGLRSTLELAPDDVLPTITRKTAFKYPHDLVWLMRQPETRWKTLLAYLNSFGHVARCLAFLGIAVPESVVECGRINGGIRARFSRTGSATTGDLARAMELMLDASVDAIFALENYWRERYPVLASTTEPPDATGYRAALFAGVGGDAGDIPSLPPAIRAVLRRCAIDPTQPVEPPVTESLGHFYSAFQPYSERLQRFLLPETERGRSPNSYIHRPVETRLTPTHHPIALARLASTAELVDPALEEFLLQLNAFAAEHGLRVMTNWSNSWEYPWIWHHGLHTLTRGQLLVDLGTELSPIPWFLATRGIRCVLIETDRRFEQHWIHLRDKLRVDVQWHFVENEILPLADGSVDAVTSFSVIEHQPDKPRAITEVVRVLRPDGLFAVSFDICEPEMGMTFPEWNGRALTMKEFEQVLWFHPAFGNTVAPSWNLVDISAFKQWHLRAAPYHNYVVGAAILRKALR
jgi:SAM-dependent methyltransferase